MLKVHLIVAVCCRRGASVAPYAPGYSCSCCCCCCFYCCPSIATAATAAACWPSIAAAASVCTDLTVNCVQAVQISFGFLTQKENMHFQSFKLIHYFYIIKVNALATLCFGNPMLPYALVTQCFSNPILQQPYALTTLCFSNPMLWQPNALATQYLGQFNQKNGHVSNQDMSLFRKSSLWGRYNPRHVTK